MIRLKTENGDRVERVLCQQLIGYLKYGATVFLTGGNSYKALQFI